MARLGRSRTPPPGLTGAETVRLILMVIATLLLLGILALLLTGKLNNVLAALVPAAPEPTPTDPGEPGPEQQPAAGGGDASDVWPELGTDGGRRPGLPIPRLVPDPGDDEDETWKHTENYTRYREYVQYLAEHTDAELAAEVDPDVAVFSHVWRDPEAYQGKVIRLRGILVRRVPKTNQPEDLPEGVEVTWEVQLFNYGSRHIYTLDLIGDCPAELLNQKVTIDAIFFDVIEYRAKRNIIRRSCFFVGRTLRPYRLSDPSNAWMIIILIVPVLAVLVFAFLEARKLRRFERRHLRPRSRREYERRRAQASARESAPAEESAPAAEPSPEESPPEGAPG
jgi:hypothetical protein